MRNRGYFYVGVIICCLGVILGSVFLNSADKHSQEVPIQHEIVIPDGYEIAAVSSYGRFFEVRTVYCKKQGTEEIVVCTNGSVGEQIHIPDGYRFLDVSSWGDILESRTIYVTDKEGNIFELE